MKLHRHDVLVILAALSVNPGFGKDEFQGEESTSIQPRIVGGRPAQPTDFPYFAQWFGNPAETTDYIAVCAATLIHSDVLLTAAHCNGIANNAIAIVGAYYSLSSEQGVLRTVINRVVHPGFNRTTFANDFLVLKLDSPVQTAPVGLNDDPAAPRLFENLTIIGVGQMNETGGGSQALRQVSVNYVEPAVCSADYVNVTSVSSLLQLCTGVPGGGKGPCYGDSGGPVLNSKGVQVGVVSASVGCARAKYPAIHGRVSGAVVWIKNQVCELSSAPPSYCRLRHGALRAEATTLARGNTLKLGLLLLNLIAQLYLI